MSYPQAFPEDIWGHVLDCLEPFLLVLLPCVCKSLNGDFIVRHLSSLYLAEDAPILPDMPPSCITQALVKYYKLYCGIPKLSRLHLGFSLTKSFREGQHELLQLTAPNLRSFIIASNSERGTFDKINMANVETLRDKTRWFGEPTLMELSPNGFTRLTSVQLVLPSSGKIVEALMRSLASTPCAQLTHFELCSSQRDNPERLGSLRSRVTRHHSTTLKKVRLHLLLSMKFPDLLRIMLGINFYPNKDLKKLQQRIVEVYGLPTHRIWAGWDEPLFNHLVMNSPDDNTRPKWIKDLCEQLIAPIVPIHERMQEISKILRRAAPIGESGFPAYRDIFQSLMERSDFSRFLDQPAVGLQTALKLIARVILSAAVCQVPDFDVVIDSVVEKYGEHMIAIVAFILNDKFPLSCFKQALPTLLSRPRWKEAILRHCSSTCSVLVTRPKRLIYPESVHVLVDLLQTDLNLCLENDQGCTLVDTALISSNVSVLSLLRRILQAPTMRSQFLSRVRKSQMQGLLQNLPPIIFSITLQEKAVPKWAFEEEERFGDDRYFAALYEAFETLEMDTKSVSQIAAEDDTRWSRFVTLFRSVVPSPSVSTERRLAKPLKLSSTIEPPIILSRLSPTSAGQMSPFRT
eukprot:TRINITY_DN3667_c0_g1_i1.p1 TRINITY_DN3667_c0_g1~~TRINITY_DN3667_c0_g1_i1.p1  ORF type:complete len:631 (-),score=50.53 TRINITY_DN3667_c0_g1_i1:7-1899(-)